MKKDNDPRFLALKTLSDAQKMGKYINLASDASIKTADMTESDTALFTSLVYGVTERRITLDYIISRMATKGGSHIDPRVKMILRLGLYQIIYLDKIPVHAAVNETVALCKNRGEASFVNAILRNYVRDGKQRAKLPDEAEDRIKYLSVAYSFPEWICTSLCRDYGYEDAKGILAAFCSEPPSPTLRINTLKVSTESYKQMLQEQGVDFCDTHYANSGVKLAQGAKISELVGFDDGLFFVQDEASQISTEVLSPEAGEHIIDVCSCPGSKSFGAAIEMKDRGTVRSFDLHKNKLSLVEKSASRLGITVIKTKEQDGKSPDPSLFGSADRVICDVPCSGLGVMAKKPDIRYKSEEDVSRLSALGYEILDKSAQYLKDGGVLLYSTCTLRREENEDTVEAFLRVHPEFSLCPFTLKSKHEGVPDIVSDGMLTLMPHVHGTDGFFIAKIKKAGTRPHPSSRLSFL